MNDKVFMLKDVDFNVSAAFRSPEGGQPAFVTIMDPERDAFITMRADDFLRMAKAVENAL